MANLRGAVDMGHQSADRVSAAGHGYCFVGVGEIGIGIAARLGQRIAGGERENNAREPRQDAPCRVRPVRLARPVRRVHHPAVCSEVAAFGPTARR